MDAVTAALVGGLGGALIGAASTLGATWVSGRSTSRQQRRDAVIALERDRLGRLRDDYAVLLGLAQMWLSDIRERQFLLGGESEEQRNLRLARRVQEMMVPARTARLRLALEPSAQDVTVAFDEAWNAYIRHRIVEDSGLLGSERVSQLNQADGRLQDSLQKLEGTAKLHLGDIEARIRSDA